MIPDIAGIIVTVLTARGYYKKGSKDLADAVKMITAPVEKVFNEIKNIKETLNKIERNFNERTLNENIEKAVKVALEPVLQKATLDQQTQINNDIKTLSTGLTHIATGIITIGGSALTSFNPLSPGMTSSVITEQRSASDGTEDYLKNK